MGDFLVSSVFSKFSTMSMRYFYHLNITNIRIHKKGPRSQEGSPEAYSGQELGP